MTRHPILIRRLRHTTARPLTLLALAATTLLAACGGGEAGGGSETSEAGLLATEGETRMRRLSVPIPAVAANAAPRYGDEVPAAAQVGEAFSFTPPVTDPDNDGLQFTARGLPAWASLDPGSGTLSGTPTAADVGSSEVVLSVTDGRHTVTLPAFPLAVAPPAIDLKSVVVNGTALASQVAQGVATAVDLAGEVEFTTCGLTTKLAQAQLRAEFDADGRLARLAGTTDLPGKLSPYFGAQTGIKTTVGLYRGSEINANRDDFTLQLKPDLHYLVYFIASEPEIEIGDRKSPGQFSRLTLSLPLNAKRVVISDPCDVMNYRYHGTPAGDVGYGESDRGLLPFTPTQTGAGLDRFDGHRIEQGKFGLGIKVFDVLSIEGTRITRNPSFDAIDWQNPLDSKLQYKAGINGKADIAFGVMGVGLFEIPAADASLTLDVGLERQHMAMQATIAPDVSWQPKWFPILPAAEVVGRWQIDGKGRFEAQLTGDYRSTLPKGHLRGLMRVDNQGAVIEGAIEDDKLPLSVRATFRDQVTTVQINTPRVDLGFGVQQAVKASLDRELAKVQQAMDALRSAAADYEFEASLRGLRSALPGIADTAVKVLDAIPGQVRNSVDSGIVSTLRNTCKGSGIFKVCASSFVNETSIGDSKGAAARSIAASAIAGPQARLLELKRVAQLGDDASLRQALIDLLNAVYDARTVKVVIPKYTVSAGVFGTITIYPGKTTTHTVLSASTAAQIKTAAEHAPRIQQTSDVRIGASAIVDALPTEQAIQRARSEVDQGLARIPSFDGAGYEVRADTLTYTPYLILGGQRHGVSFNLLDPVATLQGIGDAIAGLLTGK